MDVEVFENDAEFAALLTDAARKCNRKPAFVTDDLAVLKKRLKTAAPSLFFIDIVMEHEHMRPLGLEAAREIQKSNDAHLIVFITNYLSQILGKTELQVASFNLIYKRSPRLEEQIETTLWLAQEHFENGSLIIRTRWDTRFVPLSSILFVEAVKATERVRVHTLRGVYTYRARLKDVLAQLDSRFVFSARGCIVNTKLIEMVDKKERVIQFKNGERCPYTLAYAFRGGLL